MLPTYGEYHIAHRDEIKDGYQRCNRIYFQPQMNREEAVKYYNKKLRPIWLNGLTEFPASKRNKILDYLLGGKCEH